MRQIGFSHGVLYKLIDVYSKDNIKLLEQSGSTAIEINCHSHREAELLTSLLPLIGEFERVSLHLPCDVRYRSGKDIEIMMNKIQDFYFKSGAKLAVVHPDLVDDWKIFNSYEIDWAVENMDDRKRDFKSVASLKDFFECNQNWKLVLDLGHCNVNDKTMKLADEMIEAFADRIQEVHLSGYETFHDPLYRTRQADIIEYCKKVDAPIIIESTFEVEDGVEGVNREFDYILRNLS